MLVTRDHYKTTIDENSRYVQRLIFYKFIRYRSFLGEYRAPK